MENRVALLSIIVEDTNYTDQMNALLHEYREFIIGRMGIPYQKRNVALISIAMDAPVETLNALSGKLGRISGISSKVIFAKL